MTKVSNLLKHPLSKSVTYSKLRKCYVIKKGNKFEKLKGITSLLRKCFWPTYAYSRDCYSVSTGAASSSDGFITRYSPK